ncbi:MAG TPA: Clp protease N-terminal domain-containing protein [Candidatus Acidoferrales bacterium]
MFQRYTESARRVIFFARYEASQFGTPTIEAEYLLLGLLRENSSFASRLFGERKELESLRLEIEKRVTKSTPLPTSVEIPLSLQSKNILHMATEEAERLGSSGIGTEHLLLALLKEKASFVAQILEKHGIEAKKVEDEIAKTPTFEGPQPAVRPIEVVPQMLAEFLQTLQEPDASKLAGYFSWRAQIVDANGKRWVGIEELEPDLAAIFLPYAKRNARPRVERVEMGLRGCVVASVLWENVAMGGEATYSMHRMMFVLAEQQDAWEIFFLQVTPVRG